MIRYHIPFNRPRIENNEFENVTQTVANGHISSNDPFTNKCQSFLKKELNIHHILLTPSCTHALELAALLLDIRPGDEIIVPSFAFVSTVNAFVLRGARPVFADIHENPPNLDPSKIERLFSPRTRAVVVVHYAGISCEMDEILAIASRHELPIIEDNAHGLFARYRNRYLGTFGTLSTVSFHETKNISCGEGGALFVNDQQHTDRAEILREKGTDRSRFLRGDVEKYSWIDIGSSYLPSELQAAFLYAQLEARERIFAKRRQIWKAYNEGLQSWARANGVQLPIVPLHCEQPFHIFYMLLPSAENRRAMIAHLESKSILSVFHYLPLHLSPMGARFGGRPGDCPVAEKVSGRLLRLPLFTALTPQEQQEVITAVQEVRLIPAASGPSG